MTTYRAPASSSATGRLDFFFLVSCEHGGRRVPPACRPFFAGGGEALASHRGYDPGALILARELAAALRAPLVAATVSRLVIDLNRSERHPRLYSEFVRAAPAELRREIRARYYRPYRRRVATLIAGAVAAGRAVLHLSSHSFTPQWAGEARNADIGLLYDPARPAEAAFCRRWQAALAEIAPALRVRRNYPYRGTADGLCTALRRRFPAASYAGIELEINQRFVLAGGPAWRELRSAVLASLRRALE